MNDTIIFALFLTFVALIGGVGFAKYHSHKAKIAHEELMKRLAESNDRERERRRLQRESQSAARAVFSQPMTKPDLASTRVHETTTQRQRFNDDRTMIYNDDSDILTAMILQNALNSSSDTNSGSVLWNGDTPTITPDPTPSYTPSYESSSSSSYSSYSSSDSSSSYSSDSSSSDSDSSSSD